MLPAFTRWLSRQCCPGPSTTQPDAPNCGAKEKIGLLRSLRLRSGQAGLRKVGAACGRVKRGEFAMSVIPTGMADLFFRSRRANVGHAVEGPWQDIKLN